jgi:hypothetical protein
MIAERQQSKTRRESDGKAIFGLTWRSIAYLPVMLSAAVLVLGLCIALIGLPLLAVVCVYVGLWGKALSLMAVWLLVCLVYRRFGIRRFFERPPSYL